MKMQHVAAVFTSINVVLLGAILLRGRPAVAQGASSAVRAQAIDRAGGRARVRVYLTATAPQQPTSTIAPPSMDGQSTCAVTPPNRHRLPSETFTRPDQTPPLDWYGNDALGTTLWPDGTIVFRPGGAGFVLKDGSLQMKCLWAKVPGGRMTIVGHRLDAPNVALRADINHQFDNADFQPSYLIFATPGCWEVTASVGDASLSFVTAVVKIGKGPGHQLR